MKDIPFEQGSDNVFADMGFSPAEVAELTVKSSLITAIGDTIKARKLTQQEAARLCGADQPTLSKVLPQRSPELTRVCSFELTQ
jgi:predicted XRE-type DNA-binding protein